MDANLQQSITNFVTIVLGGVITIASIFASIYVKKAIELAKQKAEQIQDDDAKKKIQKTMDKMNDLIQTGITALENTSKKDILNDIALGKCDKSALNQLAVDVKDNVLKQLGDGGVQILNGVVDDVNDYVSKKIEATLADLKVNPNSSVSKTVIPTEAQADLPILQNQNTQLQASVQNLQQQVNQIANEKSNIEQANQQLVIEKQQLEADKQALQSKLDSITQVVQTQPITDSNTATINQNNNNITTLI